jgi:hypothetical protein
MKSTKCEMQIKNGYINIRDQLEDNGKKRAVGLRIVNKFKINSPIPHKRLSIYMTDVLLSEEFKGLKAGAAKIEGPTVFFHHNILVIELPRENLKSVENLPSPRKALYRIKVLKFQSIIEKWVNNLVIREWIQIYSKLKSSAKKDIKKKRNALREFLVEDIVQNYKKYKVGNKLLVFISLVLNTGDIYYSFLRNRNKLPDLKENIPWVMDTHNTKPIVRPDENICRDLLTISVNIADVVYEFMKDKSKLEKIVFSS